MHEQARQLREEAQRARDEALGAAGRLGEPAGARFHSGEQDWDQPGGPGWGPGPGWTDWPGRRGWEDWARMRGRHGWTGSLDFGTLRDLERLAVQFTSDLRKLATQSTTAGENVISDLRDDPGRRAGAHQVRDLRFRPRGTGTARRTPTENPKTSAGPAETPADDTENPAKQD